MKVTDTDDCSGEDLGIGEDVAFNDDDRAGECIAYEYPEDADDYFVYPGNYVIQGSMACSDGDGDDDLCSQARQGPCLKSR